MSNQFAEETFRTYELKALDTEEILDYLKEKHPDATFPRVSAQIEKFNILKDLWRDIADVFWNDTLDERAKYQPDPNDYWSNEDYYEQGEN